MSGREHVLFAPEVEALLREAAADPSSLLLRAPRRASRSWSSEPVRPSATDLTKLERHLLLTHRAAVAEGLRAVCVRRLIEVRAPVRIVLRPDANRMARVDAAIRELHAEPQRSEARRLLPSGAKPEAPEPSLEAWLAECPVAELVEVAQRFEPSIRSEIHGALAALSTGDPAGAARRAMQAIESTSSIEMLSYAWCALGTAQLELRQDDEARAAYRIAWRLRPDHLAAALSCVFVAIQTGDGDWLHRTASDMDAIVTSGAADGLTTYLRELAVRRRAGLWMPSEKSRRLIRRPGDGFGTVIQGVLDGFK